MDCPIRVTGSLKKRGCCDDGQSGGGGGSLATVILEDEVMAEQNQDTSLLSACRSLMTAITKVIRGP